MSAATLLMHVESLRRSEPARALESLEGGFHDALRGADAATRGQLWRTRAAVLRALSRSGEAVSCYARADRWYERAGDPRERGRCAIGLVDALMYVGRYGEARRAASRGRKLLTRAEDKAALARLLNNEGNLWHRLDLPERALTCYRDAARALERTGDAVGARMIRTNVGNCLSLLGRCDEARTHYIDARRASEAAGSAHDALIAEYSLAYLDFLEHHDEAALAGLARVRDAANEHAFPAIVALARLDRAEIFLRMGAHDEALGEAADAIVEFGAQNRRYELAKAEVFAALAQFRLGQATAAREGIERAIALFDAEGNQVWTGEALLGLATIWWKEGNPRAAAVLLTAARRRFADAGDPEREACATMLEARAHLACGDVRAARRGLARAAGPRRRSPRLEHLRLASGAALAREEGDLARARRLLARAARAAERLAARILDEQWRATFWGEWGWPHRELAALELAEGRFAEAFDALEAGRGRSLLGGTSARHARGAGLPAEVRRWAASRHARERARRSGETIVGSLADREPGGLRRALASVPPDAVRASTLQRSLPPDALLLDYLLHDGSLGALALSHRGLAGHSRLASESQISQIAHSIMFALRGAAFAPAAERAEDRAVSAALAELAAMALWPMLGGRVPRALAIAPVGPLTRIPWAALPLPDGQALCERTTTVLVPGLRLGLARRAEMRPAGLSPLVIAVDTGDLDAIKGETEAVLAAFPRATVLAGADATAERFLAMAPHAPWIHFAGHGGWRADAPHESGLRLVDRWVLAAEVAELSLCARWVTLSACHTARALVRPGEEWFGLARSFLLAGAGAVIAAQWDVEDEPTARLMGGFYGRLAAGEAIARALAGAQLERHRAGAHPFEWSGFAALGGPSLLGEGDPEPRRGPRRE